ncbi:glycosyltransferase family 32 protein [Parabacteroides sp. AM08-6]|uniref:glycosyltransferase family 32 protein n=1 Tax=Parabacteroides sp. AM08-6 TaxID=2292053 RepID=UPI000EFEC656|nr:glycosyltransferase [Parabacteroides sp. AM08-6]RHJ75693.1 hypothetical protein DW103_17490 [Parabacteroides sp. AM08-6]
MNEAIPKIIHQVWSGVDGPLPDYFHELGETWKEHHPSWKYMLWDNERMNIFLQEFYPEYIERYQSFYFNIQRWDVIRYLILYQIGGLYADFDYECLENIEPVLKGDCCFAMEPEGHRLPFVNDKVPYFNNALMASRSGHPFMKAVIETVFSKDLSFLPENETRFFRVLCTTGPKMLSDVYLDYSNKDSIYLIPAEEVSPFSTMEIRSIKTNEDIKGEWASRIKRAYAIHYFIGTWDCD